MMALAWMQRDFGGVDLARGLASWAWTLRGPLHRLYDVDEVYYITRDFVTLTRVEGWR